MLKYDFDGFVKDTEEREVEATRYSPGSNPYPPHDKDRDRPPHDFRPGSGQPSGPPHDFGPGSGQPSGPPHDFEHGGRGRRDNRKPGGPPPSSAPAYSKSAGVYAVDPGAISGCLYNYTYVWLRNGRSFWLFPTYIGQKSISGYRWSRFGWSYIGLDLDLVDYFRCSGY